FGIAAAINASVSRKRRRDAQEQSRKAPPFQLAAAERARPRPTSRFHSTTALATLPIVTRQAVSLVLGACMLHLNVERADLVCANHSHDRAPIAHAAAEAHVQHH